jgi:transposase
LEPGFPGRGLYPGEKRGEAVGITSKGKGSKLMAVVDGEGIPLGLLVENANPSEIKLAELVLATVRVQGKNGRPKSRPKELVADKGYDSDPFRRMLRKRGIHPCIPLRKNRKVKRGRKTNISGYHERWHVERTFGWIESFRRLATRFERLLAVYYGLLYLAATLFCLRRLVSG